MRDDEEDVDLVTEPLLPVAPQAFRDACAAARAGARDEFDRLLAVYQPYLLAIANRQLPGVLAGKVAPSDLVQDSMLRGFERFDTFQGTSPEELARWLRQILLNQLANARQAHLREKRNVLREQPPDSHVAQPAAASPSEEARRGEERARVAAAIARLPAEYAQVIQLRHEENLSYSEIGVLLSRTENAARKLWLRAIEQLQQELGPHDSSAR